MQFKSRLASLTAAALVAVASIAGATSAQAYPAGQDLSLNLDTTTVLTAGATIHGNVTHVYPGCQVTIKVMASGSSSAVSTARYYANGSGNVSTFSLKTPAKYGYYVVRASTSGSCAGGAEVSDVDLTVGYVTTLTTSLRSTSSKISAKPSFVVTGSLKYGGTGVSGVSVSARIIRPDSSRSSSYKATTNGSGAFSFNIARAATVAGTYTAIVTFAGATRYLPSSDTSNGVSLTLR